MATLHPFLRPPCWRLELPFSSSRFNAGSLRLAGPHLSVTRSSACRRECGPIRAKAKDYYATLNLTKKATLKEIKTAYRNLARKVLSHDMSLATVRTYIWKKPEDLVLNYRIVQNK